MPRSLAALPAALSALAPPRLPLGTRVPAPFLPAPGEPCPPCCLRSAAPAPLAPIPSCSPVSSRSPLPAPSPCRLRHAPRRTPPGPCRRAGACPCRAAGRAPRQRLARAKTSPRPPCMDVSPHAGCPTLWHWSCGIGAAMGCRRPGQVPAAPCPPWGCLLSAASPNLSLFSLPLPAQHWRAEVGLSLSGCPHHALFLLTPSPPHAGARPHGCRHGGQRVPACGGVMPDPARPLVRRAWGGMPVCAGSGDTALGAPGRAWRHV